MELVISDYVRLENDNVLTTSRMIAERFEKDHKHVLDIVDKITEELGSETTEPNFRPSEYLTRDGRMVREFILTKKAAMLITMRLSGPRVNRSRSC